MAVTALAASMTFGAVPAMATPALAASTVTADENANYLGEGVRSDVERILQNMSGVTSATTADDIKKVITSSPNFSNYNIEVTITDPDGHGTPSGYYDDGQHYDAQGNYHDYHNFGKISGTVMLSDKNQTTPDSQKTTLYNFVLEENTYTAEEKIALAEHFIQKYFDDVKPFNASDVKVEGKDGDVIGNPTMTSMAEAALNYYYNKGITEFTNDAITVSAADTSAPVNTDKNNTLQFTTKITVSVGKTSDTKTYTATRDRAHSYLNEEFANAVKTYLKDPDTKFANDIDAEKLAGVINNLRFAIMNGKGVGSTTDPTYFDNFNGQAFANALTAAGIGVDDYAQLKHISVSASNIQIGEANKVLAKHDVDGRVSVDFTLKEDGNNDDQVFTAELKLKQSADEMLTEMTDEMTRLFKEDKTILPTITYGDTDNASAPAYVKATKTENGKTVEDKANDTLGGVKAIDFANALLSKAGDKKFNNIKGTDDSGNVTYDTPSYLRDDHVSLVANSAVYSDYVEPTTKADGSVKITATVQVQNPWYATYDGTMTPDEQYVTKDVSFTVTIPKLTTVPATDIELANARTIYVVRGYNGKLDNAQTKPTTVDLKNGVSQTPNHTMSYVKPANANDIVWTSSDPSVATVDENGIVTALKGGKTVITAASETNPKISDSITINVKETYNGFVDVTDPSAYYYDPIYWAKDAGVTAGTTATTFSPSSTVSRADMITWLYRYAGSPAVSTTTKFKDVKDSDYYAKAVAWATSKGITFGTSDTTFSPKKAVKRAEMISFLYRYSQAVGKTDDESGKSDFNDVLSSKYYASAVAWGAENGVVAGYADGTFRPDKTCTRAEGVSFIYRAVNHTKGQKPDNLLQK